MAAGNDLIVNCGMFATGMTCSHEQLLMDEEISAMSRRIAAGMTVNSETIAADLIKQIGPRGEGYLTTDHTLSLVAVGGICKTTAFGPREPRNLGEPGGQGHVSDCTGKGP